MHSYSIVSATRKWLSSIGIIVILFSCISAMHHVHALETSSTLYVLKSVFGNVTSQGNTADSINCGDRCIAKFPLHTRVTLTATPKIGYIFAGWKYNCKNSVTSTCTLEMNGGTKFTTPIFRKATNTGDTKPVVNTRFATSSTGISTPVQNGTVKGYDLIITDMSISPSSPKVGEKTIVYVTLKNQGTLNIAVGANIGVGISDGGSGKTWVAYYNGLAAGQSVTVATNSTTTGMGNGGNWIPSKSGDARLSAYIDDLNRLPNEINEDNNRFIKMVNVIGAIGSPIQTSPTVPKPIPSTVVTSPVQAPTPINGTCGTARGQTFTTMPKDNLCSSGIPSAVSEGRADGINTSYTYTWSCKGINQGTTTSCSANRNIPGSSTTPVPTTDSKGYDLIITDMSISPSSPKVGEKTIVYVTLKNQGTLNIAVGANIGVGIFENTVGKTWVAYYNGLAAGQSVTVATNSTTTGMGNGGNWIPSTSGNVSLTAFADDPNRLPNELNENNNKLIKTITVSQNQTPGTSPIQPTPTPINGTCGTARGQTFTTMPKDNLCSSGIATSVSEQNTSYSWSCTGMNQGATISCSASRSIPSSSTIQTPTPAPTPINGACGISNGGTFSTMPTQNLCTSGTTSVVSGSGPWNWSCGGVNGGKTLNCSANKQTPNTNTGATTPITGKAIPIAGITAYNNTSGVGTNLAPLAYWSSQIPFINVFKLASTWYTTVGYTWDTEEQAKLDLDADGYPKSLTPKNGQSATYTSVATLIFRDLPEPSYYPSGQYILTYDGEGTIEYSMDATKNFALSSPGRDILDIKASSAGIYVKITATDPKKTGNYIKNIKLFRADQENLLKAGEIFNPAFLEKTKDFSTLRFMDWMSTNNNETTTWSSRQTESNYTWSLQPSGAPLEVMIRLANKLGAHPWFTIPAKADDNYVMNFAQVIKTNLDPRLITYIEYSNEVWNGQFQQRSYVIARGNAESPALDSLQWHALRTRQVGDIVKNIVGSSRVITTLGAQAANPYTATRGLDYLKSRYTNHGIDAVAIAPYMGVSPDPSQASKYSVMTMDQIFAEVRANVLPVSIGYISSYKPVASAYGVPIISYEGGQHMAGIFGAENDDALTRVFTSANRDSRMGPLYKEYLTAWKNNGGQLFVNFLDVGEYSKWGSWGSIESILHTSSPKYDALHTFIAQNPCWWANCTK